MTTATTFISESSLVPVAGINLDLDHDLDLDINFDIDIDIPTMVQPLEASESSDPPASEDQPDATTEAPPAKEAPPATEAAPPKEASPSKKAPPPTKPPPSKGYAYLFKYVIVGDSGVGKTALIRRFCGDFFQESRDYTIGMDFDVKTVQLPNGDDVKLQVCR